MKQQTRQKLTRLRSSVDGIHIKDTTKRQGMAPVSPRCINSATDWWSNGNTAELQFEVQVLEFHQVTYEDMWLTFCNL
jgi:hypothetical protein